MATVEELINKSSLQGLVPVVKNAAILLIKMCHDRNVELRITHGYRSLSEQQKIYDQGRTAASKAKGEKIVTNAKPGYSLHNFGLAIDIYLIKAGYDLKADKNGNGIADWMEVVTVAKLSGFEWGGDWEGFVDSPHFEMNFGLKTAQLRNGAYPTIAQMKAVQDKLDAIQKKEEPAVNEELKLFKEESVKVIDALDKRVKALEKRSVPPVWANDLLADLKSKGLMSTANDKGYDAATTLTILNNAGLLTKEFLEHVARVNKGGTA